VTIDIEGIRARRAAITPGPWQSELEGDRFTVWSQNAWTWQEVVSTDHLNPSTRDAENAKFIAAAPADIDALLAEVERLRTIAATVAADLRREMDDAMSNEWPDLHGDVVRNAIRRLEESKEAQP